MNKIIESSFRRSEGQFSQAFDGSAERESTPHSVLDKKNSRCKCVGVASKYTVYRENCKVGDTAGDRCMQIILCASTMSSVPSTIISSIFEIDDRGITLRLASSDFYDGSA